MDNPEYTFQILEVFSKIKTKEIPRELEEYISYVARTGDPVFQWSLVKVLIKEKLLAVLNEFKESNPSLEIPPCPNVDPFNYESMKNNLLSRLDSFILPPFTIQRICELLSAPRKEYNRIDKYMRAVEKNVLVVSACELSLKRGLEADGNESMMNGMLYDKVNDSLSNFTNHVFSTSHESNVDELHLSGKLPENDAVQQILDESWTEAGDGDEFKLNETSNTSLSVSFDNELQFVTEKNATSEKLNVSNETEPKNAEQSTSFAENDSLLIEPSLQNMIVDNANISYDDDTLKSNTSTESETTDAITQGNKTEENVTFAFTNDDSHTSTSDNNSLISSSNENESSAEKKSFDTSLKNDDPTSETIEHNLVSGNDEASFSQVNANDKDESSKTEIEEQYKNEHIFEYDDFSEISTKTEALKEYCFDETSKDQVEESAMEYSDEMINVDGKSDDDDVQSSTATVVSSEHDKLTTLFQGSTEKSNQIANEPIVENETEKQELAESFSCGDKESSQNSNPNECPKESDPIPAVHGVPELTSTNVEQSEVSSTEKYEHCISSEADL